MWSDSGRSPRSGRPQPAYFQSCRFWQDCGLRPLPSYWAVASPDTLQRNMHAEQSKKWDYWNQFIERNEEFKRKHTAGHKRTGTLSECSLEMYCFDHGQLEATPLPQSTKLYYHCVKKGANICLQPIPINLLPLSSQSNRNRTTELNVYRHAHWSPSASRAQRHPLMSSHTNKTQWKGSTMALGFHIGLWEQTLVRVRKQLGFREYVCSVRFLLTAWQELCLLLIKHKTSL